MSKKKYYNVLDIACFIINKHNELYPQIAITNIRLQKLLYFVQAYFIIKYKEICFSEKIVAYPSGSVVIEVYEEFKKYGRGNIQPVTSYGAFDIPFFENVIDTNDRELITYVINMFSDYSDSTLVDITHCQTPWKNSINKSIGTEIDVKDIENFFLGEG